MYVIYIYKFKIKKKATLSSRQACFVIANSSGVLNDKNIKKHGLNTVKGYIHVITVAENSNV